MNIIDIDKAFQVRVAPQQLWAARVEEMREVGLNSGPETLDASQLIAGAKQSLA